MIAGYFFPPDQKTVNYVNTYNCTGLEDLEIFNLSISAKKQRKYRKGQMQGELVGVL